MTELRNYIVLIIFLVFLIAVLFSIGIFPILRKK